MTNIAPRNRYTGTRTTSAGAASSARRPRAAGRRDAETGSRGLVEGVTTGGSVDRWDANHSDPSRAHSAAHPTPAAGCTWVASKVTAAGPITKHSSSATDSTENAVCSRGESPSKTDQRARAIGPVCGMVAPPMMPHRNNVQSGARSVTAAIRPTTDTAKITHTGISTRCWPSRSVRRPSCGAQIAKPTAPEAETVPARPYRPVSAEISSTVPSPYMDMGIRPRIPATEKHQARGIEKISRYGARNPRRPSTGRSAPPALVIACLPRSASEQNLKILPGSNRFGEGRVPWRFPVRLPLGNSVLVG